MVRSSAGDAQGQLRGAAALHQPRDLVPAEVVGVDLGQRPGDAEPGEPCYAPVVHERLFIAAGLEAVRAFSSAKAGPVIGHLLLGLADLAAGVIALAWPGPTALVLVLIVASWAVVAGLVEITAAFGAGEPAGTRALFILGGLASVAFGVVLFAHPGVGAVTLALLFGLFNLIYGIYAIVQGIELRRTRNTLHSVVREKAPA